MVRRFVTCSGVALAFGVLAVGCGTSQPKAKPEAMMARAYKYYYLGQWGRMYDLLHPGQQHLVSRRQFIQCEKDQNPTAGYDLLSIKKVNTIRRPIHDTGVPQHMAVTVTFHLTDGLHATATRVSGNTTGAAVWTGTRWTWVMPSVAVAAYRAGQCPPQQ